VGLGFGGWDGARLGGAGGKGARAGRSRHRGRGGGEGAEELGGGEAFFAGFVGGAGDLGEIVEGLGFEAVLVGLLDDGQGGLGGGLGVPDEDFAEGEVFAVLGEELEVLLEGEEVLEDAGIALGERFDSLEEGVGAEDGECVVHYPSLGGCQVVRTNASALGREACVKGCGCGGCADFEILWFLGFWGGALCARVSFFYYGRETEGKGEGGVRATAQSSRR
jgi:hypothetical protein